MIFIYTNQLHWYDIYQQMPIKIE
uniref:Uncharacterized protein n=1 Tax=Anguilla anguilla TaxID=7936 RepID=A0A0E9TMG2_ANGAN